MFKRFVAVVVFFAILPSFSGADIIQATPEGQLDYQYDVCSNPEHLMDYIQTEPGTTTELNYVAQIGQASVPGARARVRSFLCDPSGYGHAENFEYCEYIIIWINGQVTNSAFVCGLPATPYTIPMESVLDQYGEFFFPCDALGVENFQPLTVDRYQDLVRTVNCDNPIKELVPQEIRDTAKSFLRGLIK